MRPEFRNDTGKRSLGWKDVTGIRALECRNDAGNRSSECRKSEWFYFVFYFPFLVYSVLAGGVPVKVRLVEELGPVSVVRSGTADLRQNVVHRRPVQCGPRVPDQHPDAAPRVTVHILLGIVHQDPDNTKGRVVTDVGTVLVVAV